MRVDAAPADDLEPPVVLVAVAVEVEQQPGGRAELEQVDALAANGAEAA